MRVKVFYYLHGYMKHTKIKENSCSQKSQYAYCYKAKTTTGNEKNKIS